MLVAVIFRSFTHQRMTRAGSRICICNSMRILRTKMNKITTHICAVLGLSVARTSTVTYTLRATRDRVNCGIFEWRLLSHFSISSSNFLVCSLLQEITSFELVDAVIRYIQSLVRLHLPRKRVFIKAKRSQVSEGAHTFHAARLLYYYMVDSVVGASRAY